MKRLVAKTIVEKFVRSGQTLGLGSGTTSEFAVRHIGGLLQEGKLTDILGVPTSTQTEFVCHELAIPITTLNDPRIAGRLDLAIDGPDEVDAELNVTKGGGAALTQEKIVDYAADRYILIADETKVVERIGPGFRIPVEVLPLARVPVTTALEALGAKVEVRMALRKMGPVITDNGNILLDIRFPEPIDAAALEKEINTIPGVLENGIFARRKAEVWVAYSDGRVEALPPR